MTDEQIHKNWQPYYRREARRNIIFAAFSLVLFVASAVATVAMIQANNFMLSAGTVFCALSGVMGIGFGISQANYYAQKAR